MNSWPGMRVIRQRLDLRCLWRMATASSSRSTMRVLVIATRKT
jgi:hypothetical protein